ncbi:MAG: efflux RND transporter periplasmic adaptor subunit [Candidatus Krumholzibacteriales bacterium]
MKILRIIFIPWLSATLFISTGCSRQQESGSGNGAGATVPAVEAVRAVYGTLPLTERLTGVVKAKNQVAIYPEVSAPVMEVYVKDGEYVKQGQPLIRLKDTQFRKQLKQTRAAHQIAIAQARQAEARLKEIRAELVRTRSLAEKGLTSPAELEAVESSAVSAEADLELARARIQQAEANMEEREEALSRTIVRAPVAGYVGNRNAEVGMLVSGNTRLFNLGRLEEIEIEVVLTDRMLNYIEAGQRVEVFARNTVPDPIDGTLSRVSPFLNQVTHSTEAEIDLPNPGRQLKPGMFVTVDIHYGESEHATLVPLAALYENPASGVTGVYVATDSISYEAGSDSLNTGSASLTNPVEFEFTEVNVIARGDMEAGVDGIDPGAWVISLGQDLIGSNSGKARVRPVSRDWVYRLQRLQRQNLLREVMRNHQRSAADTASGGGRRPVAR